MVTGTDPLVQQRGADLCEQRGRRGKTELPGDTRNEVDLEEPADIIKAVVTKAENRPIHPTIKGQSGTNGNGWKFSF